MGKLILASASPRRAELLSHIVRDFDVRAADIDESVQANESPRDLVKRLAIQKAKAILHREPASSSNSGLRSDALVLGSDTVVTIDSLILGKPKNYDDFCYMMSMLSGRAHDVYTGVAVVSKHICESIVIKTEVQFCEISDPDKVFYWGSNEPQDKAGGYAIQGIGGQFIVAIKGSFSAVVGLPLYETKQLLNKVGLL